MAKIIKFAKKTGDLRVLSEADLEVIALGVEIAEERGFQEDLRWEVRKGVNFVKVGKKGKEGELLGGDVVKKDEKGQDSEDGGDMVEKEANMDKIEQKED